MQHQALLTVASTFGSVVRTGLGVQLVEMCGDICTRQQIVALPDKMPLLSVALLTPRSRLSAAPAVLRGVIESAEGMTRSGQSHQT